MKFFLNRFSKIQSAGRAVLALCLFACWSPQLVADNLLELTRKSQR